MIHINNKINFVCGLKTIKTPSILDNKFGKSLALCTNRNDRKKRHQQIARICKYDINKFSKCICTKSFALMWHAVYDYSQRCGV